MSSNFTIAKMDERGLNYSMLDPKVSYYIRELGVNYEIKKNTKRLSLVSVFNSYEENHNGFFVVRYLCNFQTVENKSATIVIDKNRKEDEDVLACDLKFNKYNARVGIDKSNVARIYFSDGRVLKITNTEDRRIIVEISKDGWDLLLCKVLDINRLIDLSILENYLSKRGKVEINDKTK